MVKKALLAVLLAVGGASCAAAVSEDPMDGEEEPADGEQMPVKMDAKAPGTTGADAAKTPDGGTTAATDTRPATGADSGTTPEDTMTMTMTDAAPSDGGKSDGGTTAPGDAGPLALGKILPVLIININGQTIKDDIKVTGSIKVVEDHDGTLTGIMTRPTTLEAKVGIGLRGNSSLGYAQKPYGIELRDDKGEGIALPLAGFPKEADFVLSSCYSDKSCLRNALAYDMAAKMAETTKQWAPRFKWVEVYIDNSYQGVYLLTEKIKRDKNRVNLPEPAADATKGDITGGYVISYEGSTTKPSSRYWLDFGMTGRQWFYRSPSSTLITSAQKTYIQGAVRTLQAALKATPTWANAKKYIEPMTWIDQIILQEVTHNTDAWNRSWYFYKTADAAGGKWSMGPAWDYDRGYGNVDYLNEHCHSGLLTRKVWGDFGPPVKETNFRNEARCRYQELRQPGGALDVARVEAKIDLWAAHIKDAKVRDNNKWKNIGKWVIPNNYLGATWQDEVTYIKYWLRKRLIWLDANYPGTCASGPKAPTVTAIAAPPPIKESGLRSAPTAVYIPIEGPVPAGYEAHACAK